LRDDNEDKATEEHHRECELITFMIFDVIGNCSYLDPALSLAFGAYMGSLQL
jgi:hypothetical protein